MYKFEARQTILPQDFFLPFGGKLNPENQWCKLAGLINWGILEDQYAKNFEDVNVGQKALPVRVAVGSLIIQNRKTLSDRQMVQEITENPYMQYLIVDITQPLLFSNDMSKWSSITFLGG